mgnify:CR=1 FL=1
MKKISALLLVSLISYQIYLGTQFKINCGDYLKQASNANSTRMASNSLESALYFVEKNELTHGHTSAFYNTPDEDLGYWYRNIRSAKQELDAIPDSTSNLEKSNVLIKLKESLTDGGKIIVPRGISKHPHNTLFAFLNIFTIMLFISYNRKLIFDSI